MTLEQAIHGRWSASAALDAILPAQRFFTGRSLGTSPPYATLAREATHPVCRTNRGSIDEIILRIQIWATGYDTGCAIAAAIQSTFDRTSFNLGEGARVLSIRRTDRCDVHHDDGTWQFTLRFSARLFHPQETPS